MSWLENFLDTVSEDSIFYIGHASAFVRVANQLVFFDPLWASKPYGPYWKIIPEQEDCEGSIGTAKAVVVSHCHSDHMCTRILSKVSSDTKVIIMEGRPAFEERLGKITPFQTVPAWEWTEILENVEIYAVPHPFNTVDSAFFMRNKKTGWTFFHGNDCFLDFNSCVRAKRDVERVDVAMVPYSYVHWYPFNLEGITDRERKKEVDRLTKQSLDQAETFIDVFDPKHVIPCGGNLFYDNGIGSPYNTDLATPFDVTPDPLLTGGYILADSTRCDAIEIDGHNEWRNMLRQNLRTKQPGLELYFDTRYHDLSAIAKRAKTAQHRVPDHELVVNGVSIDLATLEVGLEVSPIGAGKAKNKTKFWFDKPIFEKWASGEITFEEALGTRRFVCRREPNVYKLEVFELFNKYL